MPTKFRLSVLMALLLGLLLAGSTQAQEGGPKQIDVKDYELNPIDYTLPNGLRVILSELGLKRLQLLKNIAVEGLATVATVDFCRVKLLQAA